MGCECQSEWSGADCSLYSGGCDLTCNGCYGQSLFGLDEPNCIACVEHAHRIDAASAKEFGICVCDSRWTGLDCSVYDQHFCDAVC